MKIKILQETYNNLIKESDDIDYFEGIMDLMNTYEKNNMDLATEMVKGIGKPFDDWFQEKYGQPFNVFVVYNWTRVKHKPHMLADELARLFNQQSFSHPSVGYKHMPDAIGVLINVKTFDFALNEISELPESIGDLSNLTYLELQGNYLTKLPQSINKLINLKKIDLRWNPLPQSEIDNVREIFPNIKISF